MANEYAIRFHRECDEDFRMFISSIQGAYIFVRETEAARTHLQGYIRTDTQLPAIRKRIQRTFKDLKGNGDYSLGQCREPEKYIRYLMKGTKETQPQVICHQGLDFTPEKIQEEYEEYWKTNEEIKEAMKTKKKSKGAILERVWERVPRDQTLSDRDYSEAIAEAIMQEYDDCNKPYNEFMMRGIGQALMCRREGFRRQFKETLRNSFMQFKI